MMQLLERIGSSLLHLSVCHTQFSLGGDELRALLRHCPQLVYLDAEYRGNSVPGGLSTLDFIGWVGDMPQLRFVEGVGYPPLCLEDRQTNEVRIAAECFSLCKVALCKVAFSRLVTCLFLMHPVRCPLVPQPFLRRELSRKPTPTRIRWANKIPECLTYPRLPWRRLAAYNQSYGGWNLMRDTEGSVHLVPESVPPAPLHTAAQVGRPLKYAPSMRHSLKSLPTGRPSSRTLESGAPRGSHQRSVSLAATAKKRPASGSSRPGSQQTHSLGGAAEARAAKAHVKRPKRSEKAPTASTAVRGASKPDAHFPPASEGARRSRRKKQEVDYREREVSD